MKKETHIEITNAILATMRTAQGSGKWIMPWSGQANGLPTNATTGAHYNGINVLVLWATATSKGYGTLEFATYKQWSDVGAQVQAGERATTVIKVGKFSRDNPADPDKPLSLPYMKAYAVFNAAQVSGYEATPIERPCLAARVESAEAFVSNTGATIKRDESRAFFSPSGDFIGMPSIDRFLDTQDATATENYYGTLLHELTHWTGHKPRLDRTYGKRFGDNAYAFEELVAEIGAAFLTAELGIEPEPRADHAKYLNHWIKALEDDPKAIFTAASAASKASVYLHGLQASMEHAA